MILTSIIVCLSFVLLPFAIRFFYVIFELSTKGLKWMDTISKPSPEYKRFRSRRWLFYSTLSIYLALFFASFFWMLYEIMGNQVTTLFGISLRTAVFLLISQLIIWVTFTILIFRRSQSYRLIKKYPRPDVDPSSPQFLEWQKNFYRETDRLSNYQFDNLGRHLFRFILFYLALLFVIGVSATLIMIFVH
jgi:hypothetical protein